MEVGRPLGRQSNFGLENQPVLILVLMEVGRPQIGCQGPASIMLCLNPCFNGSGSPTSLSVDGRVAVKGS